MKTETKNFFKSFFLKKAFVYSFLFAFVMSCGTETVSYDPEAPAKLLLNELQAEAFMDAVIGEVRVVEVKLENTGGLSVFGIDGLIGEVEANPFSFYSTSNDPDQEPLFPGEGGTCGAELKPGNTCSIFLTYAPTVKNNWNVPLVVSYNNGIDRESFEIPMVGLSGSIADIKVFETFDSNFGVLPPGESVKRILTLKNDGDLRATQILGLMVGSGEINFTGGFYPGLAGNCPLILQPSQICNVELEFKPTTYGMKSNSVSLSYYNGQNSTQFVQAVQGISADIIANLNFIGGSEVEFSDTVSGLTSLAEFEIVNSGYAQASNLSFSYPPQYTEVSRSCGTTLAIGAVCEVMVQFSPNLVQQNNDLLTVEYFDSEQTRNLPIDFISEGLAPGFLSTWTTGGSHTNSQVLFDLGQKGVYDEVPVTIWLMNKGSADITDLSLSAIGNADIELVTETSNCTTTLAPLLFCKYDFVVTPSSVGQESTVLTLTFDNGVTSVTHDFTIEYEGVPTGIIRVLEGQTQSLTDLVVGIPKELTLTLGNPGIGLAENIRLSDAGLGAFAYKGGVQPGTGGTCSSLASFDLAASTSCTVVLEANPGSETLVNAQLGILFDDGLTTDLASNVFITGHFLQDGLIVSGYAPFTDTPATYFINTFPRNSAFNSSIVAVQNLGEDKGTTEAEYSVSITSVSMLSGTKIAFVGGAAPGTISNPGVTGCVVGELASAASCSVNLSFDVTVNGTFSDTLQIAYTNKQGQAKTYSQVVEYSVASLGELSFPAGDPLLLNSAPAGGSSQSTYTITNSGEGPVTDLTYTLGPSSAWSLDGSSTCVTSLNIGESCDLIFNFAPASQGEFPINLTLGWNDGVLVRSRVRPLSATGVSPANLSLNQSPLLDYGTVVVNTTLNQSLILRNIGGFAASSISLGSVSAPYSIVTHDCGVTLAPLTQCTIQIAFTPTDVGVLHQGTYTVDFFNGAQSVSVSRNYQGEGEPPVSVHGDWSEIIAVGNTVNVDNVSLGDRYVKISWNDMTPSAGVIGSYNVYRVLNGQAFDYESPIATNISTSVRSYTDTGIQSSTAYNYTVRPVIDGFAGRTTENFSEIRVLSPPDNMVFIHRRMANKAICSSIGKASSTANNNRCSYFAVGANAQNFYDIGYDLLVDKFELGTDGTNRSEQSPNSSYTQVTAYEACQDLDDVSLNGLAGTYDKKLLTRKEYVLASMWPENLSFATIINRQKGTALSASCNGNSTNLEFTGSNVNCQSRWGTFDMAGNAWEWTSDRLINGEGVNEDQYRLDLDNTDLDDFNFSGLDSSYVDENQCFNAAVGLPTPFSGGVCPPDTIDISTQNPDRFLDGYYIQPPTSGEAFMLVGGSYVLSTTYPSVNTVAFLSANSPFAGARCAARIP